MVDMDARTLSVMTEMIKIMCSLSSQSPDMIPSQSYSQLYDIENWKLLNFQLFRLLNNVGKNMPQNVSCLK